MAEFKINLDDKPNLKRMLKEDKALGAEIIKTFVEMMEEACDPDKGIKWADLPQLFHKDLTFSDLIKGILRGSLDCKEINPEMFDSLGHDVHPLAIFTYKEITDRGGLKQNYTKWRDHFQLEGRPSEESIAEIIRNLMRYGRYVNFKLIFENMKSDWEVNAIYRGLGAEHVKRLPFYPALKYQEKLYGELGGVGRFWDEVGAFMCGEIGMAEAEERCPACEREFLEEVGAYQICPSCNAGFKVVEE